MDDSSASTIGNLQDPSMSKFLTGTSTKSLTDLLVPTAKEDLNFYAIFQIDKMVQIIFLHGQTLSRKCPVLIWTSFVGNL